MTISSFEALGVRFELSSEEEIANISAPGPQIIKVRTLCCLKHIICNIFVDICFINCTTSTIFAQYWLTGTDSGWYWY